MILMRRSLMGNTLPAHQAARCRAHFVGRKPASIMITPAAATKARIGASDAMIAVFIWSMRIRKLRLLLNGTNALHDP